MRAVVLALLLAAPLPAAAQAERDPDVANPESANLGVLRFRIDPGARVTVDRALDDRILSLVFSRQESPLAAQLRGKETPGLVGFSVVPLRASQRLDLRLANAVRGSEVIRRGADVIEIQFSTRQIEGDAPEVAAGKRGKCFHCCSVKVGALDESASTIGEIDFSCPGIRCCAEEEGGEQGQ